jgi:flagellar biosynthesis/type III secretory pathway protein FliH
MSGLIKQAAGGVAVARLPLPPARPVAPPPGDPRVDDLKARVAELEQAIEAERRASVRAIEEERRQSNRAVADARAAGRKEATADDARRIDLLQEGVADAIAAWRDRLASIDGLAATLAAAALAKVFGDSLDLAALVARTLAHHLERLDQRSVVSVGVSPDDFPDAGALTTLATRAGLAPACIVARQELAAGSCRVALRLGEVELDPTAQWAVLDRALRAMGEGE